MIVYAAGLRRRWRSPANLTLPFFFASLLVRYSGAEMRARVMVEGTDGIQIKTLADEIAAAIRKHAGAS